MENRAITKMPYKENTSLLVMLFFMSRSTLTLQILHLDSNYMRLICILCKRKVGLLIRNSHVIRNRPAFFVITPGDYKFISGNRKFLLGYICTCNKMVLTVIWD